MAPLYYRNAKAAILVFDLQSEASFEKIQEWLQGAYALRRLVLVYVSVYVYVFVLFLFCFYLLILALVSLLTFAFLILIPFFDVLIFMLW